MNPFLNTAFKAARKAGQMMIRAAGNLDAVKVDSKAFNDFVSDVDRSSEMILVEALKEAYPHHKITCEEGGSHGKATAEYEWIIDPLDGTTNFLHGHPQYAISMALLHKGVLQEALVYAPERNDVYMASRGKGALLNDRRIRVSNRIELNRCLIGTGFPVVDQSMMDKYLAILKDFLAKTAGGRREGAASWTINAPAAISQGLRLNSKKPSKRPAATAHKSKEAAPSRRPPAVFAKKSFKIARYLYQKFYFDLRIY